MMVSTIALSANPLCVSASLNQYLTVANGGTGALSVCDFGDITFDFTTTTYTPTASLGFTSQLLTNSQVTINPIAGLLNGFGYVGMDISSNASNPVDASVKGFSLVNTSTTLTGTATYALSYTVSAPSAFFTGVISEVNNGAVAGTSTYNFNKTVKNGATTLANPSITQATPGAPNQFNVLNETFTGGGSFSSIRVTDSVNLSVGKKVGTTNGSVALTDLQNMFVVPEPGTVGTFAFGFGGLLLAYQRRRKA